MFKHAFPILGFLMINLVSMQRVHFCIAPFESLYIVVLIVKRGEDTKILKSIQNESQKQI